MTALSIPEFVILRKVMKPKVEGVLDLAEMADGDQEIASLSQTLAERLRNRGAPVEWDARRGARELVAAYRETGLTQELFDGPCYKRLAHIQQLLAEGQLDGDLRWRAVPVGTIA